MTPRQQNLATVAGMPVEVTVRGERAFTFSTAVRNDAAAARLADFFRKGGPDVRVSVEHDDECGSFVYVDA